MNGPRSKLKDPPAEPALPSRRDFLRGHRPRDAAAEGAALPTRAVIGTACLALRGVECRICGDACGEGAIRFRPFHGSVAQPTVVLEACTGCGDCVAPCPTGAIPAMQQ